MVGIVKFDLASLVPRPLERLVALLFACCLFYFGFFFIQWNALLGGLALAFWVSESSWFRRQVKDNPYAFQTSS